MYAVNSIHAVKFEKEFYYFRPMNVPLPVRLLLILFAVLELLLITYWRNKFGAYVSPIILMTSSFMVAIMYLKSINNNIESNNLSVIKYKNIALGAMLILFGGLCAIIFFKLKHIFAAIAISETDTSWSDVIPQIFTLTRRFLRGEMPYYPIPYHDHALFPTYLPMQWLPYTIAEKMKIDYRWIPAGILFLSSTYHFIQTISKSQQITVKLGIAALWPVIIWATLIFYDIDLFGVTVESLIAAYYLFTASAVRKGNIYLLATGLCLTLLSRYGIIFWVPCAIAALFFRHGFKPVAKVGAILLLAFLMIYWLPFMRMDSLIFLKGYAYHTNAALGEWRHLNEQGQPTHLYNGLGIASLIYRLFNSWPLALRLALHQKIHLGVCITYIVALTYWYYRQRSSISLKTFLLFSLKSYLTLFYLFIQIPYAYLFFTPLIVTSVLLADGLSNETKPIC